MMNGWEPLITPIGIVGVIIGLGALITFIWNLFREELTHEQWLEIVNTRKEILATLEAKLNEYKNITNTLANSVILYDLASYGYKGNTAEEIRHLISYNKRYAELKDGNHDLITLLSDIEMLISRLGNKKLRQIVHNLYKREELAHCYQIYVTLYKNHYNPHSIIEKRIHRNRSVPLFEQAFARAFTWMEVMKRGKDLE